MFSGLGRESLTHSGNHIGSDMRNFRELGDKNLGDEILVGKEYLWIESQKLTQPGLRKG